MPRVKPPRPVLNRAHPLARGLVCAIPFWERGGTTPRNLSGKPPVNVTSSGTFGWVTGARGAAMRFDDVDDFIPFGASNAFVPTGGSCTVIIAWRKTDATQRASTSFGVDSSGAGDDATRCGANMPYSDGVVYWDYGGLDATHRLSVGGLSFGDDIWSFTVGPRGSEIWQNGRKVASNSSTGLSRTATSAAFAINRYNGVAGGDLADCAAFMMFSRQLAPQEVTALYADPFVLYRPARRTVGKAPAAGFFSRYYYDMAPCAAGGSHF